MTERLSTLLHGEADALDIPAPPADLVLASGRSMRRRRRVAGAVVAAAVAGVVGIGTTLALAANGDGAPGTEQISPATARYLEGGTFSVGRTVYVGSGAATSVTLDEAVKSIYYTSAGVLVRTGNNPWSDGGGPSHFSLVTPDGTVKPLGVRIHDAVPSTDVNEPYLAWAEVTDGVPQVVVRNVATDEEVARVDLPDGLTWGSWSAPVVSLSGDTVYVGAQKGGYEVDLRTDRVRPSDHVRALFPEVLGGRYADIEGHTASVRDATTGATLLDVPVQGYGYLSLSPDGRFAEVVTEDASPGKPAFAVYDVASGSKVSIDGQPYDWGWSPDGHLFRLKDTTLTTCDPVTGTCAAESVPVTYEPTAAPSTVTTCTKDGCMTETVTDEEANVVKLGGRTYES